MPKSRQHSLSKATEISTRFVIVLFLIKGMEILAGQSFAFLGIIPRTEQGLIGIIFSPLLHANLAHLLANAVPLFILLVLLFWDKHYRPHGTLGVIWLVSGLGTWLIGRKYAPTGELTVHIGASSLIFGLVAYLIVAGIFMRSWRSALIALGVFLLFGGIFYGALPQNGPISWEGHLCGSVAGIFAAQKNHG